MSLSLEIWLISAFVGGHIIALVYLLIRAAYSRRKERQFRGTGRAKNWTP